MNTLENLFTNYQNTLKFFGVITTIVLGFFAFDTYLESKIEDKITDDSYISEIAKTLRPFLIFDNNGIVKYDHGAEKFIDSIKIEYLEGEWVDKIIIYCNTYFQEAPLLNIIGVYHYSYESIRIKNRVWLYDMRPIQFLSSQFGSDKETRDNIFTLEILR